MSKIHLCPYTNCNKNYGTDVALNLHIKIKHNGGNKTERERAAVNNIYLVSYMLKLQRPELFLKNKFSTWLFGSII